MCLNSFITDEKLKEHKIDCRNHDEIKAKMPNESNKYIKFKNNKNKIWAPFNIKADFEAITKKYIENEEEMNDNNKTHKYQKHESISYSLKLNSIVDKSNFNRTIIYKGDDCVENFLKELNKIQFEISD